MLPSTRKALDQAMIDTFVHQMMLIERFQKSYGALEPQTKRMFLGMLPFTPCKDKLDALVEVLNFAEPRTRMGWEKGWERGRTYNDPSDESVYKSVQVLRRWLDEMHQ
jgi:hypothetical protein